MTTDLKRPVGSEVGVDDPKFPGVWIVRSNGPVNATVVPKDGGRGLRCPHYMLTDPPVVTANGLAAVTVVDMPVLYGLGEVVRCASPKWPGLWVVIADKGGDKVNLAKLGSEGDGTGYLRMPRRGISEKVNLADILK
jgi:hypothetical protein